MLMVTTICSTKASHRWLVYRQIEFPKGRYLIFFFPVVDDVIHVTSLHNRKNRPLKGVFHF